MKQVKLTYSAVRQKLLEKQISIFTPRIFETLFCVSSARAKYFLETYAKKDLFLRLKKGLYAFRGRRPSVEEIANALYKPSYISLEYALAKYGVIPEIVYEITSVTTKPTRHFEVSEIGYGHYTIKKQVFTGYSLQTETIGERKFRMLIAEPEKALADYLYFVALGKRTLNDRLYLKSLKKQKIIAYAKLFENKKLNSLLKTIL